MVVVNTNIAKNPMNWAIVAVMLALFMFVFAQLMKLFEQGQASTTAVVSSVAARHG